MKSCNSIEILELRIQLLHLVGADKIRIVDFLDPGQGQGDLEGQVGLLPAFEDLFHGPVILNKDA